VIDERNCLGELPKGWIWVKVRDVVSNISLTGRKLKQKQYVVSGKLPVVDQGQKFIGGYTDREELKVNVVPPVIVFGDHTKIVKYVDFDFVAGADGVKVLKPLEAFYPRLFYYFLHVIQLPEKGYARHFQFLQKSFIPLPPFNEQVRIVVKLEELFTRLDAGVEGLQKVKAQLKRYRQAVLKYAFEGKLTEEWRETHKDQIEPATTLLERIKQERRERLGPKYKELPSIDLSELPELPQSWIWVRLGEVADTTSGGTPSRKKKEYYGGRIPWLKSGELKDGAVNVTEESITEDGLANSSTRMIPKGTLLIALYGATVGKLGVLGIDSAVNQAICAIFPNNGISRDFLFWYLRKYRDELLNIRKGGAQPNISQDVVRNTVLPLPSIEEQQTIVDEVESRMYLIKEVETVLEKSLKQADRLRQGILKQAFEGKLVPQDPSDEPAEKLLERIKAERAKSKAEKDINKKKIKPKQLELSTYVK